MDLSCGDGRNLALLQDLGFEVYATEIFHAIVTKLNNKKEMAGWNATFASDTLLMIIGGYGSLDSFSHVKIRN